MSGKPSRRSRKRGLELSLVRQQLKRDRLVDESAPKQMITETDGEIVQIKRDLHQADIEQAWKASIINAGKDDADRAKPRRVKDRLALTVAHSSYLTRWHYRVGEALRALDELPSPGVAGVSGQAGDGSGGTIRDRGVMGDQERGEEFWGAMAVPQPQQRSIDPDHARAAKDRLGRRIEPPRTFKPKAPKDPKRHHDGGLVSLTDRKRRADRLWRMFLDHADAAGLEACGRVGCGKACQAIIRGDSGLDAARTRFVRGRGKDIRIGIQIAMATGLEAVANRLGFRDEENFE